MATLANQAQGLYHDLVGMVGQEITLTLILRSSWRTKEGIRVKDAANYTKLAVDSLFEALQLVVHESLDDSQIWRMTIAKEEGEDQTTFEMSPWAGLALPPHDRGVSRDRGIWEGKPPGRTCQPCLQIS